MVSFRGQKKLGARPDGSPLGVWFKNSDEHPRAENGTRAKNWRFSKKRKTRKTPRKNLLRKLAPTY